MYKLFLTIRYLTRKKIVIFPILVVWLCVMMLVIVSSIMGGFVDRVRETNHDLMGDIIISSPSYALGFSKYDELQSALKADKNLGPLIEASTATVEAYGLVYIPEFKDSRPAILVGVDPVERSKVTQFRESLFDQYTAPKQAIEDLAPHLPATADQLIDIAGKEATDSLAQTQKLVDEYDAESLKRMVTVPKPKPDSWWLLGLIPLIPIALLIFFRAAKKHSAGGLLGGAILAICGIGIIGLGVFWPLFFPRDFKLLEDRLHQAEMDHVQADRTLIIARSLPTGTYTTRDQLTKAIMPAEPHFSVPAVLQQKGPDGQPGLPPDGCIIGSELGFFKRDTRGNFERGVGPLFTKVIVTVFPADEKTGAMSINANNAVQQAFTIVDDSHTGVFDVDQTNVYAPLSLVQQLAGLAPDPAVVAQDKNANFDPRVQEILIKLTPAAEKQDIHAIRAAIGQFVETFWANAKISESTPDVQTWDEKQARYLNAVQNEETIVVFCIGLMSLVVLVVIFLIFYQIVRDKTRDIGIIKAVGGSEEGVAGIFLTFGLFIGVVGGGLGDLGGWLFVTHTNQIHEFIFHSTGIVIWDRSVYLFDRIPDVVHPSDLITYFVVAVVAGVLGALIPAVIAGAQDPVEAVRYE